MMNGHTVTHRLVYNSAMFEYLQTTTAIQFFGISGCLVTALGSLMAGLAYRGKQGQRYSPLNHFISELGEVGVSRWSWAFNLGLILSGVLLLPCIIGLGLHIPGIWSKLGMIAGCLAAVGLGLVGVFPMNNLKPHGRAATMYFRMGLLMIFLFTIAIALQKE